MRKAGYTISGLDTMIPYLDDLLLKIQKDLGQVSTFTATWMGTPLAALILMDLMR